MALFTSRNSELFAGVLSSLYSSFSLFSSPEKSVSAPFTSARPYSAPPETLSEQLEKQHVFPVAKFPSSTATVDTASWKPQLADSQTSSTLLPPMTEESDTHEGFLNSSCGETMVERDAVPHATGPSSLRLSHISGAHNSGDNLRSGPSESARAYSAQCHNTRINNSRVQPPYSDRSQYGALLSSRAIGMSSLEHRRDPLSSVVG